VRMATLFHRTRGSLIKGLLKGFFPNLQPVQSSYLDPDIWISFNPSPSLQLLGSHITFGRLPSSVSPCEISPVGLSTGPLRHHIGLKILVVLPLGGNSAPSLPVRSDPWHGKPLGGY